MKNNEKKNSEDFSVSKTYFVVIIIAFIFIFGLLHVFLNSRKYSEVDIKQAKAQASRENLVESDVEGHKHPQETQAATENQDLTSQTDEVLMLDSSYLHELGVSNWRTCTSVSTSAFYNESTMFYFMSEAGAFIAFVVRDGHVATIEFSKAAHVPTILNYVSDKEYQKIIKDRHVSQSFVQPSGEVVAVLTVNNRELPLNRDQFNTLSAVFKDKRPDSSICLSEIGKFGYYEDGLVSLTDYLHHCGLAPDKNGIYWASAEDTFYQEGFKLDIVSNGEFTYVKPTFYAKTKGMDDLRSYTPDDDAYNGHAHQTYQVAVNGTFTSISEAELEGIMQCVQRGEQHYDYNYLDPGGYPIHTDNRHLLYYKELYE